MIIKLEHGRYINTSHITQVYSAEEGALHVNLRDGDSAFLIRAQAKKFAAIMDRIVADELHWLSESEAMETE